MRREFYEEYARIEREHWWFIARRRIILTVLNRFFSPAASRRPRPVGGSPLILDVGLGSGVMLKHLERFGEVLGCDSEQAAIQLARKCASDDLKHGRIVQAEAEHLPFITESLDLITVLDLLEHTVNDVGVLRSIEKSLKHGGFVCITAPMHEWLWGNQDVVSRHVRRYRPGEMENKVRASGLEIVYTTYFNFLFFPIIALIRLARRWTGRSAPLRAEEIASDFSMTTPGRLNNLLAWLFSREAWWITRSRLPLGVSVLCLARKKGR